MGREGGTQRKVTRFTGNARKPRERGRGGEEGRGRGKGEQRRWIERMEGEGEGRVHARRVSYN